MSTPTMAPTSLPRAATLAASSAARSRPRSRPSAVSLTEMLASRPPSWMRSSATDIPAPFSSRIVRSASSNRSPAMNRRATRQATGLLVTCRFSVGDAAAFSSVALSTHHLDRHQLQAAPKFLLEEVAALLGRPHVAVGQVPSAQVEAGDPILHMDVHLLHHLEVVGVQAVGDPQQRRQA